MDKVVFLDRDGVINCDSPNYIKNCDEFEFLPGSLEAIKNLTLNGFNIIVITNQSVINRKMVTLDELEKIFSKMKTDIATIKGKITDIFFCPHLPSDNCQCRKPKIGLIKMAEKKYKINLSNTVMVGDSAKDIECARNAGCGKTILVKTGNIVKAVEELAIKKISADLIVNDLNEASNWIIQNWTIQNSKLNYD